MAGKMARLETHNLSLLCIQNVCITFEHLVCFTRIPTLSGLFLAQLSESHAESVKEEHIKHWARTVRQRHAFQHLEVLVMSRFAIDMNDTINAVSPFPNLHLVGFAERSRYGSVLNSIDTASGTWKLYNSTLPEDPRHLWDSPNHTTKDKMRKLHASSRRIRQVVGLPEPTLGISYGASSNRFTQPSEWYMRTGKSRLEDVAKRRQGCEIDGIAQNVKKQRTVRAGKQADLNSLLGQFT